MSVTILGPLSAGGETLPLYSFRIPAGFPSPAADHIEKHISLDELFDIRAPHVYLAKIEGDSMQGAGIFCGDLVIVNRSLNAEHGDIVIAGLNAEPICKRLHRRDNVVILLSANSKYPPRYVMEGDELVIWGVVTYSVRDHGRGERNAARRQCAGSASLGDAKGNDESELYDESGSIVDG